MERHTHTYIYTYRETDRERDREIRKIHMYRDSDLGKRLKDRKTQTQN